MKETQIILMVDDSDNDLLLTRTAFKKAAWKNPLREVRNGEEAIAYLKGEGPYYDRAKFPLPAAILSDLKMPRKNGFDLLAWVRAQPTLKSLPIVILTASTRPEDLERAFDLGATCFLVKPTNLAELVEIIRSLCGWVQVNEFPPINEVLLR